MIYTHETCTENMHVCIVSHTNVSGYKLVRLLVWHREISWSHCTVLLFIVKTETFTIVVVVV